MNIDFIIHLIKIYKNRFVLNLAFLYFIKKLDPIISFHRKKYLFKSYCGCVSKCRVKINSFCNDRFRVTISFQLAESIIGGILRLYLSFLKVMTYVMKRSQVSVCFQLYNKYQYFILSKIYLAFIQIVFQIYNTILNLINIL